MHPEDDVDEERRQVCVFLPRRFRLLVQEAILTPQPNVGGEFVPSVLSQHGQLQDRHVLRVAVGLEGTVRKARAQERHEQAVLTKLEPRPGRSHNEKQAEYIAPDIYVKKVGDEYVILQNDDGLPKLRISNYYRKALEGSGGETKEFIQEKMRAAAWLIRSIHMRQRTIYRVMESILKFQQDFFEKGVEHLKPLVLKDVAEDIEMHESTISRVTTNKYVHTPQGIFELKYFFDSKVSTDSGEDVSARSVKERISRLIEDEDKTKPLSDQEIADVLGKESLQIARRTVAKYRDQLGINSQRYRKAL